MISECIDPTNFLNDLLEIIYFIQQKKSIGNIDSDFTMSESEQENIETISKDINMSTLIVFWQFILKTLEELLIVSNPILSLEMLIVRLIYLKDMPSYEKVLDSLKNNNMEESNGTTINLNNNKKNFLTEENETVEISKDQIKNTIQTKPDLPPLNQKNLTKDVTLNKVLSFNELINLSSTKREIQLKYDLEKNVNLIKFSEGKIDISFNENLDKNFVRNLSERLLEWTGKRWVITLTKKPGQKTFSEMQKIKNRELFDKEKKGEIYKKFKSIFPDVELMDVIKKD
jgi:DNA polymerase-3 subunit gamma/tau